MITPFKKLSWSLLVALSMSGPAMRAEQEANLAAEVAINAEAVIIEDAPSITLVSTPLLEQKKSLCDSIAAHNYGSILPTPGFMMGNAVNDPYAFYNFISESITNPQALDRRRRAFKILASAEQKKMAQNPKETWQSETIIDPTTWQDLNLLVGSKENPAMSLAAIMSAGRTHTELGKAYLAGLIARPIAADNVDLLSARQEFIRTLVNDDELRNNLDKLLQKIAISEPLLTGLWDTEMLAQFIEMNYSKLSVVGPTLNKSSLCLELKSMLKVGGIGLAGGILAITPVVMGIYGLSQLCRGKPALEKYAGFCFGQTGLLFEAFPSLKNRWIQGIAALGVGAVSALALKQSMHGMNTIVLLDGLLRKRFVHIAMYDEAANAIATSMMNEGKSGEHALAYYKDITGFFADQVVNDPELAQLEDLLRSDTFEKGTETENQFFFSRGNTLCAYYLLSTIKDRFETMMAGLGELDAFLTIAKLIKESTPQAPWCFASYENNALTPAVQLTDFWNPFIDPKTVVLNSIALGLKNNVPNVTATGPNSSGKSTMLKSIALSVVLAQSVGVAPASSMSLTPYSYLVTYMNVADSLVDKESRFQAEARRVFEYGDKLEELSQENKFSFAIFDEIFSGTSPAEGAELGFKVSRIFSEYLNSTSVVATHFELLTTLEQVTSGQFINYKTSVVQNPDGSIHLDENGKIVRTYKFVKGISNQHIAREVFKERGAHTNSHFFNRCFDVTAN
jgi:hypothetical protein